MTTISKCLIAILITAISPSLYAQDLHISQYPSAPMHLDPSMTGMAYDGTMVSLHYRTQWSPILGADNAFSTMSASAEHRRNVKKTDFFSYGLGVWTDKAAAIKLTQAKIAVSYARQLAGTNKVQHYLVGGGDVSLMQRVIDFTDRQWVNQYDGNGGHDPNRLAPTFDFPNKTTYDVSAGISWYSLLRNSNYLALGLTAQHLNRADLGLQKRTIQANLYVRYIAHFDSEIKLKKKFSIQPSLLFMKQGPSMQLTPGASIKCRFNDHLHENAALRLGGWVRLVNYLDAGMATDAVIAFVRLDWRRTSLGVSYDFNTSLLNQGNKANNAIELLLSYRFAHKGDVQLRNITPRYL